MITFNTVAETTDGMGGYTEGTTAKYSGVWGNVKTIKGQRLMEFQELHNAIWYEIDIMQDSTKTILAGDTIAFAASNVISVFDIAKKKTLWSAKVDDIVYGLAAADKKLYASTKSGTIYCFQDARKKSKPIKIEPLHKKSP